MFYKKVLLIIFLLFLIVSAGGLYFYSYKQPMVSSHITKSDEENQGGPAEILHPLSIAYMRQQEYPGSEITIEQTLPSGSNYDRYIASYKSDGLKIYALLTVPQGEKPKTGWPVIIFNHGYIPPAEYRTTERYIAYTDAFSRNEYIVFRPDYRGHGNSEGNPEGAYYSPAYSIDVLNAVSAIKKYKDADVNRLGMWGHSMGGSITLRTMVTTNDIKVGVIWAGVVASYNDMIKNWRRPNSQPWVPSQREQSIKRPTRQTLIDTYGDTDTNPTFWNSISPISYVNDISGPIQLHHGTADAEVPLLFSQRLEKALKKSG
jgi:dipeptidyl aminopeptidase/acylaminoacyl peptidase